MENSILFTYLLVGGFLLLNLVIGLYKGRNIRSFLDYATGNKVYSTRALVMTYMATFIGGAAIFKDSTEIYRDGILALSPMFGIGLSLILRAIYIAPKMFYFRGCLTMGDMFGKLYGEYAKKTTGVINIVVSIAFMVMQISAIGLICDKFMGLDRNISIIMGGLSVVLYSSFGGMRAVVATDILQFILLSICIVILTNFTVYLAGGTSNILIHLPKNKFEVFNNPSFFKNLTIFLMWGVFSMDMQIPAMIQRMLMAGNGKVLRKTCFQAGFLNIFIRLMISLIGFAAIILYPNDDKTDIITSIYHDFLHPYLRPFIVVGLISIVLSSADSYMHAAGVSFTNDLVIPFMQRSKRSFDNVKIAKISTLVIGVMGVITSLMGWSMAQLLFFSMQVAIPITAAPMLLGIFGLKSDGKAFFTSVGVVVLGFIICKFSLPENMSYLIAPITSTVSGITLIVLHLTKYGKFVWEKRECEEFRNSALEEEL